MAENRSIASRGGEHPRSIQPSGPDGHEIPLKIKTTSISASNPTNVASSLTHSPSKSTDQLSSKKHLPNSNEPAEKGPNNTSNRMLSTKKASSITSPKDKLDHGRKASEPGGKTQLASLKDKSSDERNPQSNDENVSEPDRNKSSSSGEWA